MIYQEFYPVITSEKPANTQYSNTECKWKPIVMKALKDIKQTVVSDGMHSPFIRELVKVWASSSSTILASLNLSSARRWTTVTLEILLERET